MYYNTKIYEFEQIIFSLYLYFQKIQINKLARISNFIFKEI